MLQFHGMQYDTPEALGTLYRLSEDCKYVKGSWGEIANESKNLNRKSSAHKAGSKGKQTHRELPACHISPPSMKAGKHWVIWYSMRQ